MKRSSNFQRPPAGPFGGRFVLGITGGIASGKSTVLKQLADAGVPAISADDLSHACLQKGHPVYRAALRHFGKEILTSWGEIDRRSLGKIVFAQDTERRWLQKQIHPYVWRGLKKFIRSHAGLIALDIPLLYEAHYEPLTDHIAVVYCTRAQQIARLKKRNPLSAREIRERLAAQWPLGEKRERADIVLNNTRNRAFLRMQVKGMLNKFSKKSLTFKFEAV